MRRYKAMLKLAALGLAVACLLPGVDEAPQAVEVTKTDRIDFPANGTLRVQNSTGELTIEGWDQPGIEIMTTKSSKEPHLPSGREKAMKDLDRVRISTKRNGDELILATEYPRHRAFPWVTPLQTVTNFDLVYRIKVPRNAKVIVKHGDGDVYINDVAANIEAKARQGMIALRLVSEASPVIDAKSDMGQAQLIHRPPDRFTDMSRMLKPQEFKGHVAQRYVVAMQCRLSHLEGIVARAILHGWVVMPSRYGDKAKSFTVEPRRSFHVRHA